MEIYPKLAFAMCSGCFIPIYLSVKPCEILIRCSQTADDLNNTPTLKQQILNTEIKVFSQVCTMKNEMIWQANEIESLINGSVYDSGAYVQPFNTTIPGQGTPPENETPKGLLPP
jgi:hypothetical protein